MHYIQPMRVSASQSYALPSFPASLPHVLFSQLGGPGTQYINDDTKRVCAAMCFGIARLIAYDYRIYFSGKCLFTPFGLKMTQVGIVLYCICIILCCVVLYCDILSISDVMHFDFSLFS